MSKPRRTIRTWRREHGWSQDGLARRLGVTHTSVTNWEAGRNEPSAKQLVALAKTFGVSMEQIEFDRDLARLERQQEQSAS